MLGLYMHFKQRNNNKGTFLDCGYVCWGKSRKMSWRVRIPLALRFPISFEIINIGETYEIQQHNDHHWLQFPFPTSTKNEGLEESFISGETEILPDFPYCHLCPQPLQMTEDISSLTDEKYQANLPHQPTNTCFLFYVQFIAKSEIKYFALKDDRNLKSGSFPAPAGLQAVFLLGKDPNGKI